jgi:uncharacterized Zn finger protein
VTPHHTIAADVAWSRLLVLQSKRLLLGGALRRMRRTADDESRARAEALRAEAEAAAGVYHAAEEAARFTPLTPSRVATCRRLIGRCRESANRMNELADRLDAASQYEIATDVQMFDELIELWNEPVRPGPSRRQNFDS